MIHSPELEKKLLEKVIEMGDMGIKVTTEDLPFLIADLSGDEAEEKIHIESCIVTSGKGVVPTASLALNYNGQIYKEAGMGDGGYDAFMEALSKIAEKINLTLPQLVDYQVRIPPGGKTSALVETIISWDKNPDSKNDTSFRTVGLNSDQISAAIMATEKMLNLLLRT
ncbi:MAG: 2-isopropylmalate synthase, partial [Leptospiraceae bacterium]|nr:2-isopropylmalate synthase [Leptospiraceae bacterium]